jgi:hypothetical protein
VTIVNRFYLPLLLLPLLAACSGGGASTSSALPQTAALPQTELAPARPLSGASDLLYVGNTGNNSITVYNHAAQGNTAPLYVIAGSRTGINSPGQLSADAQGNLYVANGSSLDSGTNPGVLVFAHGANGNVSPIRNISGPSTGIKNVRAMIVDKTTGNIFVADNGVGAGDESTLMVFPPNATGNIAPLARMAFPRPLSRRPESLGATMHWWAIQLALDSSNKNIIIPHEPACCRADSAGVDTFSTLFQNNAILQPLYSIDVFSASGVADDPTTKTYLTTKTDALISAGGLYRFAENTVGNGADPSYGIVASFRPPVVSIIRSETCGGQLAVAPGPTPNTYVVHGVGCPSNAKYPSVYVYTNSASGSAKPLRILSGPATKMNQPYGITEGY